MSSVATAAWVSGAMRRGYQAVPRAAWVKPGRRLAAPVAVGPLHAVALGDEVDEAIALVLVEPRQPCALGVRAGPQLIGQALGQRN